MHASERTLHAQDIKTADWSDEVAPFWDAVIRSALSLQGVAGLFRAGWTTLKVHLMSWCSASAPMALHCNLLGVCTFHAATSMDHLDAVTDTTALSAQGALVMPLMAQGYRRGLIKFNLITARKP